MTFEIFKSTVAGGFDWLWQQITFQVDWTNNYFWFLTILSLVVWFLEIVFSLFRFKSFTPLASVVYLFYIK